MQTNGYQGLEEHVGEVRLGLRAPSLAGLFEEAGVGLARLLAEEPPERHDERVSIELSAADVDALLVAWLDELIFRTETTGCVFDRFEFRRIAPAALEATALGGEPETWRTAVKAATFHGLRIEEGPHGYSASVVLDV